MGDTAEPTLAQITAIQGLTNRMTQLEYQQNQETESTTESSTDPVRANPNQDGATATDKPVIEPNYIKTATARITAQDEARTEKKTSHGTVGRV
ncbi:unnamed protein product [Arabis nemorensis]|uniref:Uncharacterized protein n=1 Tax=Arabis nemorensis TaxID=586526 RepID=A0A565CPK6_9BRAS|nr:unnamed protein product [Arabis nemorensis]